MHGCATVACLRCAAAWLRGYVAALLHGFAPVRRCVGASVRRCVGAAVACMVIVSDAPQMSALAGLACCLWTIFPCLCLSQSQDFKVSEAGVRTRSRTGWLSGSSTEFDDFQYLEDVEVRDSVITR